MTDADGPLAPLARGRATLFLLAGVLFAVDAALVANHVAAGTEDPALTLGQAFIGGAWTCAFLGLLGSVPALTDRSRWPARIGAAFAALGAVTMAAMAAASLGYYTGALGGDFSAVGMYFLPFVFLGIVFGFGTLGAVTLRTGVYARGVGLLFLLLVATFLFNVASGIAGFGTLTTVLGVVCVLTLTTLALGYLFRTGRAVADEEVRVAGDASTG